MGRGAVFTDVLSIYGDGCISITDQPCATWASVLWRRILSNFGDCHSKFACAASDQAGAVVAHTQTHNVIPGWQIKSLLVGEAGPHHLLEWLHREGNRD